MLIGNIGGNIGGNMVLKLYSSGYSVWQVIHFIFR